MTLPPTETALFFLPSKHVQYAHNKASLFTREKILSVFFWREATNRGLTLTVKEVSLGLVRQHL